MSLAYKEMEELIEVFLSSSMVSHVGLENDMTFARIVSSHMADLGVWAKNDLRGKILAALNIFLLKIKKKKNKKKLN